MLSQVLMSKSGRSNISAISGSLSSEPQEIASIVLALRTLGSFNFDGKSEKVLYSREINYNLYLCTLVS